MRWATLEDVSTLVSKGTTPTTLGRSFVQEGIPFLRAEDVVGTAVNPGAAAFCISEETDELLSRSRLQPGDLLITIAGTLGRIGYVPMKAPPLNCNQAVAFVRLKPQVIDLLYACFACQAQITNLINLRKIGTIGNLNLEQVRQFRIPLPPLSEQKRIASLLSRSEGLRRTRRYALELTDSFLPAAFLELFGDLRKTASQYNQVPFGDFVEFTQLGLVRGATEMRADYPYPYLRMDAIVGNGQLALDDLRQVKATADEVQAFKLCAGDFLFNTRNSRELVGKTALYTQDRAPLLFNNNIMRIRFKTAILPEFMVGLFQTDWLKRNLERIKSGTTSVFAIYYKDLADLPIVVPTLPLQQRFAALVERVEHLRTAQREALRQAEHLFASLLHRAFSG